MLIWKTMYWILDDRFWQKNNVENHTDKPKAESKYPNRLVHLIVSMVFWYPLLKARIKFLRNLFLCRRNRELPEKWQRLYDTYRCCNEYTQIKEGIKRREPSPGLYRFYMQVLIRVALIDVYYSVLRHPIRVDMTDNFEIIRDAQIYGVQKHTAKYLRKTIRTYRLLDRKLGKYFKYPWDYSEGWRNNIAILEQILPALNKQPK